MKKNEENVDDDFKEFFKQKVNFAIVVNGDLESIQRIKRRLADEGFHVVYQKTSIGKLIIKEEP